MTTTQVPEAVLALADTLLTMAGDAAAVVSQNRCIDVLLDIYNCSPEPAVQAEVCRWIGQLSKRTLVAVDEVRAAALDICAAAAVEGAFGHLVLGL